MQGAETHPMHGRSARTTTPDAEVLIAGAGPVGLSVALALARQGISCQLFEALPSLSDEARASTFHPLLWSFLRSGAWWTRCSPTACA